MMDKIRNWVQTVGVVVIAIALLAGQFGGSVGAEGDSNFTNLVASGSVTAGTSLTAGTTFGVTGATTLTGTTTAGVAYIGTLIANSGTTTITAANTSTLTAAQICGTGLLEWAPNVVNASLTMPVASTTATTFGGCFSANGQYKDVIFKNTSSTDASGFIFSSSTSVIVRYVSTSPETFKQTSSTPTMVRFVRTSSSTLEAWVTKFGITGL